VNWEEHNWSLFITIGAQLKLVYYHCNKQVSIVLISIQFDTNVSQLLRPVLPWSYDPLPSLGELSSSSLNRLSVCLSCLFWLCIPPVVTGRSTLCLRYLRVALFSERKKGVFFLFFKNMTWRQAWRQVDVRRQTSVPPHLTVWRQVTTKCTMDTFRPDKHLCCVRGQGYPVINWFIPDRWFYYSRIKKGEGQGRNVTLETMMHSEPVKLGT
jgi:hypothetical protein